MKNKILILTVMLLIVFGAGVTASSGINLFVNGKQVIGIEAKIIDGSTYVPLRAVSSLLGAEVGWDSNTRTATVDLNVSEGVKSEKALIGIDEIGKEVSTNNNVEFVEYAADGEFSILTYYYRHNFESNHMDNDFEPLLQLGHQTNANLIKIVDIDNATFSVESSYLTEFYIGNISVEELAAHFNFDTPTNIQTNTSTTTKESGVLMLYAQNDDNTYLGKLTSNEYDTESIFNEFGSFGSEFSQTSIWNEFSTYGSQFSNYSALNDIASKPPVIYLDGEVFGYLTTNSTMSNGISPIGLLEKLKELGY